MGNLLADGYVTPLLCKSVIYISLGAILCFISMLIKNISTSVIISLSYILFSETKSMLPTLINSIVISSLAIFAVTTIMGIQLFRKYEL